MIAAENHCRLRGIAARFQVRVGREPAPRIPLYNVGSPLVDDTDEDELGPINNNPLSTLDESDKESDKLAGEDGEDEASSTALSRMGDGSNATTASPTALDWLVDGSNAPPASTTALP